VKSIKKTIYKNTIIMKISNKYSHPARRISNSYRFFFSFLSVILLCVPLTMAQTVLAPPDQISKSTIKPGEPLVPIKKVSTGRVIHRFHDTSPLSPSGRYMALFRVPFEDHYPEPGDVGEVILVDMETGEERVVAQSYGWEMQMGANVQWGGSDEELYFNDVDTTTWEAFAVKLNPITGASRRMEGTVFMASLDGKRLASHNLINSVHAQSGYGVILPDSLTAYNVGPVDTDGIFITNTETGKAKMLASIKDIYETTVPSIAVPNPNDYAYYCFKIMWNPQRTRIMTLVQFRPLTGGKRKIAIITMRPDGSEMRTAITPEQYARGGHHMAWTADGDHISMNLEMDGDPVLELITVKYDGTDLKTVYPTGSGHPSFHPGGLPLIITDAYAHEPVTNQDGFVPVRLLNVATGTEELIANVFVPKVEDSSFRVDAHPTWDRSGRYVIFNGYEDNTRCVYIADLKDIIKKVSEDNLSKK
jgi:hypothetical protein